MVYAILQRAKDSTEFIELGGQGERAGPKFQTGPDGSSLHISSGRAAPTSQPDRSVILKLPQRMPSRKQQDDI